MLPEFIDTAEFRQLANLFKRVKNIAKELSDEEFLAAESSDYQRLSSHLTEQAEKALFAEVEKRRPVIDDAVSTGGGYREAFAQAAMLGPTVDRFFTEVFIMVDDPDVRRVRLHLMKRVERLISSLADVSEIVPEDESST